MTGLESGDDSGGLGSRLRSTGWFSNQKTRLPIFSSLTAPSLWICHRSSRIQVVPVNEKQVWCFSLFRERYQNPYPISELFCMKKLVTVVRQRTQTKPVFYKVTSEFQSEKRNKYARVLAVRQSPKFEKTAGISLILYTKEVTNFPCFFNFPGKQQHSNINNGTQVYCTRGESIFFWTKLTLRRFPNPLIPRGTQEISIRRHNFSTSPLHVLHIYKQTTEYISKRASLSASRGALFS